jgi:hypothetical protein
MPIKETNEPLNFFTLNKKRRPMTKFTNKANIVHLYYRKIILHWLLFFMREIPLA